MKVIDDELLDSITIRAKHSPRLRMNYNLHSNLDDSVQKLLNALEPGTQLPIHRHLNTAETFIIIKGCLKVLFYNANSELTDSCELNPLIAKYGIEIPAGQWHTIDVLESGTVILEVKQGPYLPIESDDML